MKNFMLDDIEELEDMDYVSEEMMLQDSLQGYLEMQEEDYKFVDYENPFYRMRDLGMDSIESIHCSAKF